MTRRRAIRIAGLVGAIVFLGVFLLGDRETVGASRPQDDVLGKLDAKNPVPYFIADGTGKTGYRPSDRELALWALRAWQRSAGKNLRFTPAAESKALVRVYWADPDEEEFGETRAIAV